MITPFVAIRRRAPRIRQTIHHGAERGQPESRFDCSTERLGNTHGSADYEDYADFTGQTLSESVDAAIGGWHLGSLPYQVCNVPEVVHRRFLDLPYGAGD
jgi:hypothetical protein